MKKITAAIALISLLGCSKNNDDVTCQGSDNSLVLLRVDYLTYAYEGSATVPINGALSTADTIPVIVNYRPPGDFGNIKLNYQPTNDLLFDGDIIWMGKGTIAFPQSFSTAIGPTTGMLPQPDSTVFQNIFGYYKPDYAKLWSAIGNLYITHCFRQSGKKIGLFLYTPSVGMGNPADWDWFVIMSK